MTTKLSTDLKNELVRRAEAIAEKVRSKGGQAAQLRNLLQISQTETEVPVLRNFVRYQAARKATAKFWKPIHQQVVTVLEDIDQRWAANDPALRAIAIQHFFGYLIRSYVYVTSDAVQRTSSEQAPDQGGRRGRA